MRIRLSLTLDVDRARDDEQHPQGDTYSDTERADRHPIGFQARPFPDPEGDDD